MNPAPRAARATHDGGLNLLLSALPDAEWQRLKALLEPVNLRCGEVLCASGTAPASVIFPTTAVVSLLYLTRDGDSAEVAVIGNDGVVGMALVMGGNTSPSRAVVQFAGQGFRLRASAVKLEVARAGALLFTLLRYAQALMAQITQTALCNRHHSIDQQLCRRLLLGLDRSLGGKLLMTHESASALLGVRREGVTAAALKLRRAGVIDYSRGRIAVLDREQLERQACECYAVARSQTERLLAIPLAA